MKKVIAISFIFCFATLTANAKNYIGLEIQRNYLSLSTKQITLSNSSFTPDKDKFYQTDNFGPAIFIGTDIIDHLILEANYSHNEYKKTNNNTGLIYIPSNSSIASTSKIKIDNIGIDIKPNISYRDFNFYGIVGLNYLIAHAEETLQAAGFIQGVTQKDTGFAYSLGLGAQYMITQEVGTRLQVKYTKTNLEFSNLYGLKSINNITAISAGLLYKF